MTFELNATAQADQLRRAATSPLDPGEFSPGILSGVTTAPFEGLARGLIAKPALLAGEGMTPILRPIARDIDSIFGTDTQGFLDDQRRQNVEVLKSLTPDPQTTGMAGQMLSAVFDLVPEAILTRGLGTGILEGVAAKKLAEDRGVDLVTATRHGVVQGTAIGVGVALPLSLGLRTAPDLLYAAASNVVPQVAARSLSHQILAEAGFTDMAAQYKALDMEAIAADAILGVAFAGAGRLIEGRAQRVQAKALYSGIDAALSAQKAKHFEVDAAPGVPRDLEARDAHVEALTKATDDLIAGRTVEVPARVAEAEFQPAPARAAVEAEVQAQARAVADDAELVAKQAEAPAPVIEPLARPDALPADLEGRVANPDVRAALAAMKDETGWAQRGGQMVRDEVSREVTGRTEWIPNAEWWPGRPDKLSEARVKVAIDKAIAGEPLKAAEKRLVQYLTEYIDERLLQPLREVPVEEQNALRIDLEAADLAPTPRNVVDVDAVARASELDEAAVERAAIEHGDNDAGFMRAIKEIIDNEQKQQGQGGETAGGGEAGARAQEFAGRSEAEIGDQAGRQDAALADEAQQQGAASPESGAAAKTPKVDGRVTDEAAQQILGDTPDLIVADETGALVRADELMARADEEIAIAQQDARGFDAAVACFMRGA